MAHREIFSSRIGCAACCIAPSLTTAIPGMPSGKPAGERCVQLTVDNRCKLYGLPERPAICLSYRATPEFCGTRREEAMARLAELERMTDGGPPRPAGDQAVVSAQAARTHKAGIIPLRTPKARSRRRCR